MISISKMYSWNSSKNDGRGSINKCVEWSLSFSQPRWQFSQIINILLFWCDNYISTCLLFRSCRIIFNVLFLTLWVQSSSVSLLKNYCILIFLSLRFEVGWVDKLNVKFCWSKYCVTFVFSGIASSFIDKISFT